MATARRTGRQPGKSDPIDAEAVALAALREPGLPVAELDGPAREVKLHSDHRRVLVAERTAVQSRLRWHLHEIDAGLDVPSRGLRRYKVMDALAARLDGVEGVVARLAREQVRRCRELTQQINAVEAELRTMVRRLCPSLLEVPGCGVLSAALILGETAGVHRFRNKDAYARFNGTAPIPVWSGATNGKVRLNRGGNRTANYGLHMIAVTQARGIGPGRAYLDKVQSGGKTRTEALRLLREDPPPSDTGRPQSSERGALLSSHEPLGRGHPAEPHIEDKPTTATAGAAKKRANPAGHDHVGIDAKKADADFKISFARRSSRFSCSSSLIRCACELVTPGRRPPSTSCCLTQFRNDSWPTSSWVATRRMLPCISPVSARSASTIRTARSFNSGEYRRCEGCLEFTESVIAHSLFQSSRASV
jgi:transposase